MMNRLRMSRRSAYAAISFAIIVLAVAIVNAFAAYENTRPVSSGDEPINQGYLYGEGVAVHKGIDWSRADLGDTVYAVADGTVIQTEDTLPDGCDPGVGQCDNWGNYALIRHSSRHYDKTSTLILIKGLSPMRSSLKPAHAILNYGLSNIRPILAQ